VIINKIKKLWNKNVRNNAAIPIMENILTTQNHLGFGTNPSKNK